MKTPKDSDFRQMAEVDLQDQRVLGFLEDRLGPMDWARGVAVSLMILSHGMKGLLEFDQFTVWGLVPLHLVTRFASTLFILIFGISLGLKTQAGLGPQFKKNLMLRGLILLFWYKALAIVEMFPSHTPEKILQTLAYQDFPSYVEILGFYGLALLWIPWCLPLWRKLSFEMQLVVPALLLALVTYAPLWEGIPWTPAWRALLLEDEAFYTWGQLSRSPLVFLGLAVGSGMTLARRDPRANSRLPLVLAIVSAGFFAAFYLTLEGELSEALRAIAQNEGKHPPESFFMFFSLGGAFLILSMGLQGGNSLARNLAPITWIGQEALQAFIFHICWLFVVYRFLANLRFQVSYESALLLTLLMWALTVVWIRLRRWVLLSSKSTPALLGPVGRAF